MPAETCIDSKTTPDTGYCWCSTGIWGDCRAAEHLSQLREHADEIAVLGIKVLVITFVAGPVALAYVKEADMRWPLLVDESRALYAAYGMHRGRWRDILGWSSWWT